MQKRSTGFTLVEILVVLAIMATLLSLISPRYFETLTRSKETMLRHDLAVMRDAIDKFYSDRNAYPDSLEELVERRYLKTVPEDPVTERADTWVTEAPPDAAMLGSVYDVHSGSEDLALDGSNYNAW